MQKIAENFPSWSTMISVDCFLTVLACVGSIIVITRWKALKKGGGALGIIFILMGLWLGVCLYLADLYTMIILPHVASKTEVMAAMRTLHMEYSWYINSTSSFLIFVGLIIVIMQFGRQMRIVEAKGQALEESENLLESVFQNVPVGLLIKDADQVVERPNNTYLNWYGLKLADVVGRRGHVIENFQPTQDIEVMQDQEQGVLKRAKGQTRQVIRQFADGQHHIVNITKFPVYDKHGSITRVGSVSVDLTELVEANQRAEEARTEAEAANRQKSAFLANMSHELRTPLNAIIGFSETMLAQIFGPIGSEKYHEHAKAIHQSGHHLLDLVNDILEMGKIESEEYELSPEPFNLSEIIAGSFQIVQPLADRNQVKLVKQWSDSISEVTADKRAMRQILLNLISNAVKFTPEGGSVMVSATAAKDDLTLCVEDTGIGIPANDVPHLTNPFNQGSRKNAYTAGEGTGLGLSIVASLVRLHHGELDIRSEVGKGTRVSVFLPGVLRQAKNLVAS